MRNFMFAWLALLIAAAVFAQQALGFDLAQILVVFFALPVPQQFTICIIALMVLWLIGTAIWQSERLARQDKDLKVLQEHFDGFRQAAMFVDKSQREVDAAVKHVISSDPEEAIPSLQKRLTDAEHRTALQQSRNEAVDMNDRVEDIRRRQQALREQLGEVIEKRRAIEPVFGELKERQGHLERSLAEVETDDNQNSLADRLKELNEYVMQTQARLKALKESLGTLNLFKEELSKFQTELVPLQAPEGGIEALSGKVHALHDQLIETLDELELDGEEKLTTRVEALSKSKRECEQRIARLDDCFTTLATISNDFDELKERQAYLERSFAEVEVDSSGKSLADRLKELNHFATRTRARLFALQDSLVTLNRFKEELSKSQIDLVPLQAPAAGIEALSGEVRALHDQLIETLDKLESDGEEKLTTRVEALSKSKRECEQRIARLNDCFTTLDKIRKDFDELKERQGYLERSFAEVEVDSNGKSLADRLKELNHFATRTRARLMALQDSRVTLNRFKEELSESQTDLVPLRAPAGGIESLSGEVHALRDQLIKTLDKLELDGDEKLTTRLAALSESKLETEKRIAHLTECFAKLDTIRKDIGGLFTKLSITIDGHSSYVELQGK